MKLQKRSVLLIAVCVLTTFFSFGRYVISKPEKIEYQLATVRKAVFEIGVNTMGELDAESSHVISSSIKGDKGKIIYLVDDGMIVNKGDVLVRFDTTPFEAEIIRLEGEMRGREAVVESFKQILEWEKSQAEASINNAEFDYNYANQEYNRYLSYIKDLEELGTKGYSYPMEINQAKRQAEQLNSKLKKAEAGKDQSKKDATYKIADVMARIQKAKSELETTKILYESARDESDKTVIYSQHSGIVVHYEQFFNNQKRRPMVGDTVWQNLPLMYLPYLSSMIVKAEVRELDIQKIKVGSPAVIRVDAYPDVQLTGEVHSIGALAGNDYQGNRGEKYFHMIVRITTKDTRLRPGMTAKTYILSDTVKDSLSVPIQAVFNDGGKRYCFIYQGKKFRKTEIVTGRQNEDFVEILSRVNEGEMVSMTRPDTKDIL